jgi:hypothetical protein
MCTTGWLINLNHVKYLRLWSRFGLLSIVVLILYTGGILWYSGIPLKFSSYSDPSALSALFSIIRNHHFISECNALPFLLRDGNHQNEPSHRGHKHTATELDRQLYRLNYRRLELFGTTVRNCFGQHHRQHQIFTSDSLIYWFTDPLIHWFPGSPLGSPLPRRASILWSSDSLIS